MDNFPWPRYDELSEKKTLTPEEKAELEKLNAWLDEEADAREWYELAMKAREQWAKDNE